MNKRGFTLVELLAVMAIIAIISVIAVPNVVGVMDNNKKNKMLSDASEVIALAKYKVARDANFRDNLTTNPVTLYLSTIDTKEDIVKDAHGGSYDRDRSYVNVSKTADGVITYCVYLRGSVYSVGHEAECIDESLINSSSAKDYVNDDES